MEKTRQKGFAAWFIDNWKRKPLFSTGIALLVMVVLQILALGFDYASFGEWFGAFSRNWSTFCATNAGVGIIALGMTFVIISGGIDLAVGSTMVAIGAVIMSLIDSGSSGLLAGMGDYRRAGVHHRRLPSAFCSACCWANAPAFWLRISACRRSSPRWA